MELRPDYKQTDVGIIPDDWDVVTLGKHLKFLRNGTHSRAELSDNELVKNLHYGDIHASIISKMSPANQSGLSKEKAGNLTRLQNGDIVFVDASEDMEGVGKSVEIYDVNSTEFVAGLHTIAVRFDKKILVDGFKAYLQFCPFFIAHLRRLASGTKVYSTNRTHIATAVIPLPQRPEQKAIATALSDVDTLITSLDALIEKKKNIKQATMQELLTGKRRLAGFDEEWVESRVNKYVQTSSGGTPSRSRKDYYTGNITWITTSELRDCLIYDSKEKITQSALN